MDCVICNKWIKHPKNWIRHCNTKGHIKKALLQNINNQKSTNSQPVVNQKTLKSQPESTESQPITNQKSTNNQPEKYGSCEWCNKNFKHKQSYYRHIKYRCKKKPQPTTTTIINNITNNDNRQVVNQVHINVYGKEDFKSIMNKKLLKELEDLEEFESSGIPLARKLIPIMYNTNPNNTVQIPNMNQPYCLTMGEDYIWKKEPVEPIINEIIRKLPGHTRKMFTKYYKETKHEYDSLKEWLKSKVGGNKILNKLKGSCGNPEDRKQIEKIIKATLWNNK